MAKTKAALRKPAQRPPEKVQETRVRGGALSGPLAIFILAVTPLALVTGVFLSHDTIPKVALILCGAAMLLFLLPQWPGWSRLWRTPRGKWFLGLAMAQALSLAISTAFSIQPAVSLVGTTWRRFGLVAQLAILTIAIACASLALSIPHWNRWLYRAIVICGGITAIYGISQYFGFDPFLDRKLYAIDYLGGLVRTPSTMGHAIYFAAYLAPVTLIAAWCAGIDPSRAWRRISMAGAVLTALAIFLSGTRGSLIALACGGIVLAVLTKSRMKMFAAGAGLVLLMAAAVTISPAGADLRHRMAQWWEDPGSARLGVWRDVPALIAEYPVFGAGPDTFATAFRAIESVKLSRAYPDFIHETPHNAFIDAACGQGLPGALILAGVFIVALKSKGSPGLRAALAAMLVGSMFASLTLVTSMYLWTLAGLLAVGDSPSARDGALAQRLRVPAALVGGAFIVFAILLTVQDAAYARLRDAVAAKDMTGAMQSYETATSFISGLPGYELWSSQQWATLGRALGNGPDGAEAWRKAGDAAQLAERRGEDRFSAAYQSAILAVAAADLAGAEVKTRKAILLAPNWYKPHLLRAQILQAMKRNEDAEQEARNSLNLGWKGR